MQRKKESHESILLRAIKNKDCLIWNEWRKDNLKTIANLRRCNLENIDFSGFYLDNVNFTNSILINSKFVNVCLDKSIFDDASLYRATFKRATLKNAKLSISKCEHTSFMEAFLDNIEINSGIYSEANFIEANLPSAIITGGASFKKANFTKANLEKSIIENSHFTHTIFHNANLSEAEVNNATFKNAEFNGAILNGNFIGVNLENTDLSDANCSGINLTNSNLIKARLAGTNFTGAVLTGIKINLLEATINHQTKFDSVICDYIEIYKNGKNERYPKNRDFKEGEFEQLITNILKSFEFVLNKEENSNIFILLLLKSEIFIKDIILNESNEIKIILNIPEGNNAIKIRQKFKDDYNLYSHDQNILEKDLRIYDQDTIDTINDLTSQLKQITNNDDEHINEIKNKLNYLIKNLNMQPVIIKEKLFISHSSKDKKYGDALVKLLRGLGLQRNQIVFTSDDDYGIPLDMNIFEYLKTQINEGAYMIYLLSDNYYDSVACLNEMGAAWVVQNDYTVVGISGFRFDNPKFSNGAIDPRRIGFTLDNKKRLVEFKNKILGRFQLKVDESDWNRILEEHIVSLT